MGGIGQGTLQGGATQSPPAPPAPMPPNAQKPAGTIQGGTHKIIAGPLPVVHAGAQSLRYHLSDTDRGMIHFHDDPNSLKIRIPAAEFWTGWDTVRHLRADLWRYFDRESGTLLTLTPGVNDQQQFEVKVDLERVADGEVEISDTVAKMDKFAYSQSTQ